MQWRTESKASFKKSSLTTCLKRKAGEEVLRFVCLGFGEWGGIRGLTHWLLS